MFKALNLSRTGNQNKVPVHSKKTNSRGNHFEALESRQLMSASLTHAVTPEAARIHVNEELHVHATGAGAVAPAPAPRPAPLPAPVGPPSRVGSPLGEPVASSNANGWVNVSSDPLFAPGGPSANDVYQGNADDCWFLATLAETAMRDPSLIEKDIVQLADGTYDVTFHTSPTSTVVEHVDGLLPQLAGEYPGFEYYAQVNPDECTWVAIMEKALTYFRNRSIPANYATINYGWASEALTDLGATNVTEMLSGVSNAEQLFSDVSGALFGDEAVEFGTNESAGPLVNDHCYSVVATRIVYTPASVLGPTPVSTEEIEVRNPWGYNPVAANTNGSGATNNGYMWVSASSVLPELSEFVAAKV